MANLTVAAPREYNGSKILFGVWDNAGLNDAAIFRAIGKVTLNSDPVAYLGVGTHPVGKSYPDPDVDAVTLMGAVDITGPAVAPLTADGSGNLFIGGSVGPGAAPNAGPVAIGGVDDGGLARMLLTDTSGRARVGINDTATILASGAHTTDQTGADQTNHGARGVAIALDVTVAGTGSITLQIDVKDPASGKYVTLLTGAAVTTISTNVYKVYPTITAVANAIAQDALWRTWRVKVVHNNGNTITYSVGASLLP